MKVLPRALAIGCALEALGALPLAFGAGVGPCNVNAAGLVALLLHLPGLALGMGLAALFGLSDRAAMAASIVAQALCWTALAWFVMRLRLSLALRRANALPTIAPEA